ncbi:MAG TPA: DinB family protein [Anaerolineales bacterium]|nr:DinB family protein [Anaerolineales bacterium]
MSGEVQSYLLLMARQRREVFSRLANLPPSDLLRRPESGAWSIGENLIHATMAAKSFLGFFRLLWPLAGFVGNLRRSRPYDPEIDDVYARPGFPLWVGWLWTPRGMDDRPQTLGNLEVEMQAVHAGMDRFFRTKEEGVLGNAPLYDPAIGLGNYIQGLRVSIHHDAHHFASVAAIVDAARTH